MRLLARYIKSRQRVLGAGACCFGIFVITFALFQLPMAAVLYPAALSAVMIIAFGLMDYLRVRKRYRTLERLQSMTNHMAGMLPTEMPQADDISEEAYQQLILKLCKEQERMQSDLEKRCEDMMDYYTIWAHQIKTPIASMRLHLQNEDSALSRRLMSDLFRIEQYAEMVLVFLRLDFESTDYLIREYELDPLVRSAVKRFAGEFISRKIQLQYEPICAKVITDEKWLSFVVEQVLSNSLKYTKSGGQITISLEEPKTLCIRDTGIGIAPEDLPRIFDKGYTGFNGRSDHRASGIGLYLCKRICRNLGHSITAESVLDQGTMIRIDLSQRQLELE